MKNIKMIAFGSLLALMLGLFSFNQPVSYAEEDVFSDADFEDLFSDEDFMNDLFGDDDLMNDLMTDLDEEDLYEGEDEGYDEMDWESDNSDSANETMEDNSMNMDEIPEENTELNDDLNEEEMTDDFLDSLLEGGDISDDLFEDLLEDEDFGSENSDVEATEDYYNQDFSDIGDFDDFLDDYYEPEYVDPLDELEEIAPFLNKNEVEQIIIRNVFVEPVVEERTKKRTYNVNRMTDKIKQINVINNNRSGALYRNFFQNAVKK